MAQGHREQNLLISKVMRDQAFRQRLLRNPNSALKEIGVTVPSGVSVHVYEETPTDLHIVIPPDHLGQQQVSAATIGMAIGGVIMQGMGGAGGGTGVDVYTVCCTCGSTTSQTIMSIQSGCGCP